MREVDFVLSAIDETAFQRSGEETHEKILSSGI